MLPMLHVCPSISSRIAGCCLSVAMTASSTGSASRRSLELSKSKNTSSNAIASVEVTSTVIVSVAVLPRPSSTVTVNVIRPGAVSACHVVTAVRVSASVPPVADQRTLSSSLSGSLVCARKVEVRPASTEHGSQIARTVGARFATGAGGGGGSGAGGGAGAGAGGGAAATAGGGGTNTLTPGWNPIRNCKPKPSPLVLVVRPAASCTSIPNR